MLANILEACKTCQHNTTVMVLAGLNILTLFIERWLGKTNKTEAASILEFVEMGFFGTNKTEVNIMSDASTPAPSAPALGVDHILKFLDGIKELSIAAKIVLKDGKVNVADLPEAMALIPKLAQLAEDFGGAKSAVAEAKNISASEVPTLIDKLLEVFNAFKAA